MTKASRLPRRLSWVGGATSEVPPPSQVLFPFSIFPPPFFGLQSHPPPLYFPSPPSYVLIDLPRRSSSIASHYRSPFPSRCPRLPWVTHRLCPPPSSSLVFLPRLCQPLFHLRSLLVASLFNLLTLDSPRPPLCAPQAFAIMWNTWKARCRAVYENKILTPHHIIQRAYQDWQFWIQNKQISVDVAYKDLQAINGIVMLNAEAQVVKCRSSSFQADSVVEVEALTIFEGAWCLEKNLVGAMQKHGKDTNTEWGRPRVREAPSTRSHDMSTEGTQRRCVPGGQHMMGSHRRLGAPGVGAEVKVHASRRAMLASGIRMSTWEEVEQADT
ncbi:hypothetical protein Taro_001153 [Colocasia esculenta]|uniref:Uncharacterized protein n=1 Tax=Colocasia esculenta TaxID=4460 RepID=A0A843TIB8_COLES|nr:hypothetical protein [Colocasia esculenta]